MRGVLEYIFNFLKVTNWRGYVCPKKCYFLGSCDANNNKVCLTRQGIYNFDGSGVNG